MGELIAGRFYWALPALDPDTDHEWMNEPQPARFAGYMNGEERWFWLGIADDDQQPSAWPSRWTGDEITEAPQQRGSLA